MPDYRAADDFVEAVQAPCRAAVNVAGIVRERNTNYVLKLAELTGDMIPGSNARHFLAQRADSRR